nr:Rho GTPase-activating protein 5-like [Tanacetum cinerariifolium]
MPSKQDATHFFVSDLHPRVKEEDPETKFPNALCVQLARDRLTGKSFRRGDMTDPLTGLMYEGHVMKFLKTLILKTLRERGSSVTKPSSIPRVEMV